MAAWKLLLLATKLRSGWKRIPPEQRRRMMKTAGKTVRRHGPTVAKRVGGVIRQTRKRP